MSVFIGFSYRLARLPMVLGPDEGIRQARAEDVSRLREISRTGFSHGTRFHCDPNLPTDRSTYLHELWTENCCLGRAADVVFLAENEEQVAGFITGRRLPGSEDVIGGGVGLIDLVAVAQEYEGLGLGQKLVRRVLRWFGDEGMALGEVGTESFNFSALNLYCSTGFRIIRSAFSFHLTL